MSRPYGCPVTSIAARSRRRAHIVVPEPVLARAQARAQADVLAPALATTLERHLGRAGPLQLELGRLGAAEPALGEAQATDGGVREVDGRRAGRGPDRRVDVARVTVRLDQRRDPL